MLPQTLKVTWAPLVDMTLGPRRWHAIGAAVTVATLVLLGLVSVTTANLTLVTVLATGCSLASTLVHLPTDVVMAYDVAAGEKGRAAGWGSAANLGGGAIGGGLAIWLGERGAPGWLPAIAVAALCAACAPAVLMAASRPPAGSDGNAITGIRALIADLWEMTRSRGGAMALFVVLLPIGTGGMLNLLPAVAKDWQAGAGAVVIVSGLGGGLAQIAGSLAGGALCDRWDRKSTYCGAGVALSLVTIAMALAPRSPVTFIAFGLAYLFVMGICYAGFTAVELEAIGEGAAATKLMLLVCLGNVTVFGVQYLDGVVHDRFGIEAMLMVEAMLGIGAALLFAAVSWAVRPALRAAVA